MTITKLKDEGIKEFDEKFPELSVIEGQGDEGSIHGYDAKPYVKQFLLDQMDKAYEEGKKVQDKKYQSIFNWLSGAKGSFPVKREGEGNYYWRTPLRKRVESLKQGGKK